MTALEQPTLLLVDDDETFRQRLATALTRRGFAVEAHASVEAARVAFAASPSTRRRSTRSSTCACRGLRASSF